MSQATMPLERPAAAGGDLPLRPYQRDALDAIHAAYAGGNRRQLVSLPTGSGKTVLAAHLIKERAQRTVFVVHRDELVRQTVEKVGDVVPSLSIGVVKAERDELGADLIVASAQTLAHARRLGRLCQALDGSPALLVSDECHHDRAESRVRIIRGLDPDLLVGLTATPMRGDGLGLGAIYGERPVYHLPMIELIAAGKLSPLRGLRIETEAELDKVHTRAGELAEDELAEAVDTPERNRLIVEAWKRHASERTRTVAFCVNVAHAQHLAAAFGDAGISAAAILGTTPADERLRLFAEFHTGRLPVITNCMVLTEGYDEPGIDCVLMARPTKSTGLYIQCVGRAARRSESTGKRDAIIIDFVDNSSRHRLVTLPTLAGMDEDLEDTEGVDAPAMPEGEDVRDAGEIVDLLELAQSRRRLRERAAIAVNLFGASQFVWRTYGEHYGATAGSGQWIVLLPQGDGFVPHLVERMKAGSELRPLFDRALDVETAMSLAESRMEANALTTRAAPWRQMGVPATPAQLDLCRKFRIAVPKGATKGDVSTLIDDSMFTRALKEALAGRGK